MKDPSQEESAASLDQPPATLSANVYCDRHFNDLLRHVVAPLSRELDALGEPGALLWFSRFSRRGQHVKLRLHTPDETNWPSLKSRITVLAESFFATLPAGEADAPPRISTPRLPPIDQEDELDGDYPDRSVLWTRFRPSPRTVGTEKYLNDHRLLNLFYRCMAANTELVLAEELTAGEEPSLKAKQSQLLRTVIAGLFPLDLSPQEQTSYLAFHRDWLLRHLLSQSPPQTTAEETLERLDQKLAGMDATVAGLSSVIAGQLSSETEEDLEDSEEDELEGLRTALRDFFAHVRGFRGRPEYDLDPYTSDYAFLPLFKVLHGWANQVGVPIINELYTYQLLLRAAERTHATGTFAATGTLRDE